MIARAAIMMGPWEYFALGCCAISMVVSLSQENIFKGFISTAIGILFACVGLAPVDAVERFTFGTYFLKGGFSLTYVMLGVFAASTILVEFAKGQHKVKLENKVGRFRCPGKDLKENVGNVIRSWLVGLWIGFLPGMGAGLSNVTAYAMAKSASRHPEEFGKGTVEGVFAPETANNASIGGALIPMIALGIPGDTACALLLGALMIHGVETGPLMILMVIVFAVVGVFMAWAELPTSPMILAFILGSMLESNLRKALSYADNGWISFFQRPVSAVLLLIAIACAAMPLVKKLWKQGKGSQENKAS